MQGKGTDVTARKESEDHGCNAGAGNQSRDDDKMRYPS